MVVVVCGVVVVVEIVVVGAVEIVVGVVVSEVVVGVVVDVGVIEGVGTVGVVVIRGVATVDEIVICEDVVEVGRKVELVGSATTIDVVVVVVIVVISFVWLGMFVVEVVVAAEDALEVVLSFGLYAVVDFSSSVPRYAVDSSSSLSIPETCSLSISWLVTLLSKKTGELKIVPIPAKLREIARKNKNLSFFRFIFLI